MAQRSISVHRVTVTEDALASLPSEERNLLFLAGHIINELNSLNKVFAWCLNPHPNESPSKLNSLAQGVQAMVYARTVAGKVWEAWEALKASWYRNKLSIRLQPLLHPEANESHNSLKSYFGRANPINTIRNSFAFHYSGQALSEHWKEAVDGTHFEAVFGGTIGNNLHLGAELIANAALLRGIGGPNQEENLQRFFDDVQTMARHMVSFLEGVTLLIIERAIGARVGTVATPDSVAVTQPYSAVSIPYFCAPDEDAA